MKEFDKIIRNKMQKAEAPYPSDMWQRIQQNLPEKKRKTYPVWLYFSVILLTVSGLGLWAGSQWWSGKSSAQPVKQTAVSTEKETLASAGEYMVSDVQFENESAVQKGKVLNATSVTGSSFQSQTFSQVSNNGRSMNNMPGQTSIARTNNNEDLKEVDSKQNQMSEPTALDQLSNGTMLDEINGAQRLTRRGERLNTSTIPSFLRVFGTDQSDVIEDINSSMKKHSALQCPSFVRKDNLTFFELYFSNDYAIKALKEKNGEGSGYRSLREKTESPYLSYSAGFRIGIGWDNGVAFKTGLNYSNINEKFTYTDPNSVQIQTITTVKYIYDDQFNIIDSIKTTENVEIPGTNTVTHYNKIALFDIPLLVQYTIPGKRRLSYSLVMGPLVNLSLSQSGKILDPNSNKLVKLEEAEIYKNNIGLSFYGGLGINYQLTKKVQMSIEPNFRWMPGSITRVTHPVEQSYFLANVAAAIRYKI